MNATWIKCSAFESFKEGCKEIALLAGIAVDSSFHVLLRCLKDWLSNETTGPWLVVLDGLYEAKTGVESGAMKSMASLLPSLPGCCTLITTQDDTVYHGISKKFGKLSGQVLVPELSISNRNALFEVVCPTNNVLRLEKDINTLLDYLISPVLIKVAGYTIKVRHDPPGRLSYMPPFGLSKI